MLANHDGCDDVSLWRAPDGTIDLTFMHAEMRQTLSTQVMHARLAPGAGAWQVQVARDSAVLGERNNYLLFGCRNRITRNDTGEAVIAFLGTQAGVGPDEHHVSGLQMGADNRWYDNGFSLDYGRDIDRYQALFDVAARRRDTVGATLPLASRPTTPGASAQDQRRPVRRANVIVRDHERAPVGRRLPVRSTTRRGHAVDHAPGTRAYTHGTRAYTAAVCSNAEGVLEICSRSAAGAPTTCRPRPTRSCACSTPTCPRRASCPSTARA